MKFLHLAKKIIRSSTAFASVISFPIIAHLSLAALFVAPLHLQAEIPTSIDFESPNYVTGMTGGDYPTPGDYPSPWIEVTSGVSITNVNPISGAQSMRIEGPSNGGALAWFSNPGTYTSITISADIRPHHVFNGGNLYVDIGGLNLYSSNSPEPGGLQEVCLASTRFTTRGGNYWLEREHTLNLLAKIGGYAFEEDNTGVDWISGRIYTITYDLRIQALLSYASVAACQSA